MLSILRNPEACISGSGYKVEWRGPNKDQPGSTGERARRMPATCQIQRSRGGSSWAVQSRQNANKLTRVIAQQQGQYIYIHIPSQVLEVRCTYKHALCDGTLRHLSIYRVGTGGTVGALLCYQRRSHPA